MSGSGTHCGIHGRLLDSVGRCDFCLNQTFYPPPIEGREGLQDRIRDLEAQLQEARVWWKAAQEKSEAFSRENAVLAKSIAGLEAQLRDWQERAQRQYDENVAQIAIRAELEAQLRAAQQERDALTWQPIEMHDGSKTPVLIALIHQDGKVARAECAVFNGIGWYSRFGGVACHWRTHFMPLPVLRDQPARSAGETTHGE